MQFANDIFISYAHLDDLPVIEGEKGWVSGFHGSLLAFVAQYLGKMPRVWRDAKLQGYGKFGPEIIEQLQDAAVLIAILSPRYVESDWCQREIQTFYEKADQVSAPCHVHKRVFKVVKYPVSSDQEKPKVLQDLLGYRFYRVDPGSEKARDIRPEFGQVMKAEYLQLVSALAIEITNQLKTLTNGNSAKAPEADKKALEKAGTVYLAETTLDLETQRNSIKRELEQLNYTVLPDRPLRYDPTLTPTVNEYLERCTLSIHLVGERYGIVPEGAEQSVIALQHQLALERAKADPSFSRLVWLPPSLEAKEDRQQSFIQGLQNDADLLQMGLEDLKTNIQDKLNRRQSSSSPQPSPSGPIRIYLICDQGDLETIALLDDFLYNEGFEVIVPWFGEDEAQVREEHQANLELCDAVLLYYGTGDEQWQREQLRYLQRVERYSKRSRPILTKAIVLSDPHTSVKDRFRTREALVIKNFGMFDSAVLAPFLEAIAQSQGETDA